MHACTCCLACKAAIPPSIEFLFGGGWVAPLLPAAGKRSQQWDSDEAWGSDHRHDAMMGRLTTNTSSPIANGLWTSLWKPTMAPGLTTTAITLQTRSSHMHTCLRYGHASVVGVGVHVTYSLSLARCRASPLMASSHPTRMIPLSQATAPPTTALQSQTQVMIPQQARTGMLLGDDHRTL